MDDKAWLRYDKFVKDVMREQGIAGAAVAVQQNGSVIYSGVHGVADMASGMPVTPETIFGCASVSKSFTAMAITQLADAGKLSTDDPVVKHLPEFRLRGLDDVTSVKLRHLLSHTTGLPPMGRRPKFTSFEQHLDYLATADYRLLGKPGDYFSYCNDTFLLLGAIIERLTGMSYREYMTNQVLHAIGMPRTTYYIDEVASLGNYTALYVKNPKTKALEAQPWSELGKYEVGGGVRSNITALLRYGQVYVDGGTVEGRRIASSAGLRKMWEPVHNIGINTHYGFALQVTPNYHGVTLVEHGGGQPGVSSNFGFIPQRGIVIVVLTNVTAVPASLLWLGAANTALGLPLDEQRAHMPIVEVDPGELRACEGRYQSAEGGNLSVYLAAGKLMLEMEGETLLLTPSVDHTFTFIAGGQQKTIKFHMSNSNRAWAAFVGLRMLQRIEE